MKTWQIVLAFPARTGLKVRFPRRAMMIRAPRAIATSRPTQSPVSHRGSVLGWAIAGRVRTTNADVSKTLSPIGSSHNPRVDLSWSQRAARPSRASVDPAARKTMKAAQGFFWTIRTTKTGVSRILERDNILGRVKSSDRRSRPAGASTRSPDPFRSSMAAPLFCQPLDDVENSDRLFAGDGPFGLELPVRGQCHDLEGEGLGDRRKEGIVRGHVGDLNPALLDQRDELGPPILQRDDEPDRRVGQLGPIDDPPRLEGVVHGGPDDPQGGDRNDVPLGPRRRDVNQDLGPPTRRGEVLLEPDADQGGEVLAGDGLQGRDGIVLAGDLVDAQLGPELLDPLADGGVLRRLGGQFFEHVEALAELAGFGQEFGIFPQDGLC